jgi:hypothetical protein
MLLELRLGQALQEISLFAKLLTRFFQASSVQQAFLSGIAALSFIFTVNLNIKRLFINS